MTLEILISYYTGMINFELTFTSIKESFPTTARTFVTYNAGQGNHTTHPKECSHGSLVRFSASPPP